MAAPRVPNATVVDHRGRIAREWLRYFQDLRTHLATLTNDVTSVFGRTGVITAAASDYDASEVDNDSSVSGAFVDDALNTLLTEINKRSWISKTTTYTAAAFERVFAGTGGGAWTLTLPGSPTLGDEVWIHDPGATWAGANLTVSGNGKNIDGSSTLTLSTDGGTAVVAYSGTEWTQVI